MSGLLAEQPRNRAVGFMGGTFDPIHHGHLRCALEIKELLALDEMRLIPCGDPYHRSAESLPAAVRVRLLEAALAGSRLLKLDRREIERIGPSYSHDTLLSLRGELGEQAALCMVVGSDAYQELDRWHRWEALLDLGHLLVIERPGWQPQERPALKALRARCETDRIDWLRNRPAGAMLFLSLPQLDISSTRIRALIAAGRSPDYLLPEVVWQMIRQQQLYGYRSTDTDNSPDER